MNKETIIIAGATGLIGKDLLHMLLEDEHVQQVIVIGRRNLTEGHPKLKEIVLDSFEEIPGIAGKLKADKTFCCLGTTMKKAGSIEAFRKVDEEYVLTLGRVVKQQGCPYFAVISAMGAKSRSLFFYNRVKGDMEKGLKSLGFSSLHIFRPSLLLGKRDEHRTGEEIGQKLGKFFSFLSKGPLKNYAPIKSHTVAKGMLKAAFHGPAGTHIFASDEIKKI